MKGSSGRGLWEAVDALSEYLSPLWVLSQVLAGRPDPAVSREELLDRDEQKPGQAGTHQAFLPLSIVTSDHSEFRD